jgi:hypothetical protein
LPRCRRQTPEPRQELITVAAEAAAAPIIGPGLGFVDLDGPAAHLLAVQSADGAFTVAAAGHFDKAETLGLAGITVHDDLGRSPPARARKKSWFSSFSPIV